jgi:hypothetical protein
VVSIKSASVAGVVVTAIATPGIADKKKGKEKPRRDAAG